MQELAASWGYCWGPRVRLGGSARHEVQIGADGHPDRGPRPLRLADACWGLQGLALRELHQLSIGSCLLLRGLWLCIPVALHGGAVLLEHPAPPYQEDRASIFRMDWCFCCFEMDGFLGGTHFSNGGMAQVASSRPRSLREQ